MKLPQPNSDDIGKGSNSPFSNYKLIITEGSRVLPVTFLRTQTIWTWE